MKDNSVGPGNEAGAAKVSEKTTCRVQAVPGGYYLHIGEANVFLNRGLRREVSQIGSAIDILTASLRSELEQAREELHEQARVILQGSAEIYRHLETISGMQRAQDVQRDALNSLGGKVEQLCKALEEAQSIFIGVLSIEDGAIRKKRCDGLGIIKPCNCSWCHIRRFLSEQEGGSHAVSVSSEDSPASPEQATNSDILAWLGYWRDKMPAEAVSRLQDLLGVPVDSKAVPEPGDLLP